MIKLLLLIVTLFCFSSDVSALQNVGTFSNLTIADKGMIWNNSSNTASNQVGYDVDIYNEGSIPKPEFYGATNTSNLQTVFGGNGASISQCGLSFVQNGYYSVTFYFFDDSYYSHDYSPSFSQKTNKLGISNTLSGYTSFNYDTFDYGTNVYPTTNYHIAFYTVIFKAPSNGTCITSAFSTDSTWTFESGQFIYLGYNFEYLGDKPLSAEDIQNALSNQFNAINNQIDSSINNATSEINSNIDELKQKQDEQNETSKGIWGTLTSGLSNIGTWFSDLANSIGNFFKELGEGIANGFTNLFDGIKGFFVGDEVCEVVEQNYFNGYDYVNNKPNRIDPDQDGWITLSLKSNGSGNTYSASLIEDLDISKSYNIFIEVSDYSTNSNGYFMPIYQTSNQLVGNSSSRIALTDLSINTVNWVKKGNVINFQVSAHEVSTYFTQSMLMNWNNGTSSITFRMLITDDMSMTVDNYQYVDKEETCTANGGLFGMLTNFFKSIGDFFSSLFSFLGDSSDPDVSGLGNTAGWLPAGPVDSLVNLPLTLFSNLSTALGSACTPVVLPLPFVNKNIELPCLNQVYSKISGLSAWITSIGFIAAAFILYTYLLNLYKWVDDTLTMRENTWNDVDSWGGI